MGSQNHKENKSIRNEIRNTRLDGKLDTETHEKPKLCDVAEGLVM
jgi:hypothetical protein